MKKILWVVIMGLAAGISGFADAARPDRPVRPIPAIKHVVVVSIDGLRPDVLLLADAPVIRGLIKTGAYTFWARTTEVAVTLPSHVSMLTGMKPHAHGIEWNDVLPFSTPVYSRFPTVFETAKLGGYSTAMIAGKAKFKYLAKPGSLDFVFLPEKSLVGDAQIADEAVKVIQQLKPDVLFVHWPSVDKAGHQFGWGTAEQQAAIALADAAVGRVLAALAENGLRDSTLIILTADHGGVGKDHGPEDPRSRHIPWVMNGPGVRPGLDLTLIPKLEINTEDTAATMLYLLGAPLPAYLHGKPVLSAFENVPKE